MIHFSNPLNKWTFRATYVCSVILPLDIIGMHYANFCYNQLILLSFDKGWFIIVIHHDEQVRDAREFVIHLGKNM